MAIHETAVIEAAQASPLFTHEWADRRGVAPHGYIKGMALAFAEAHRLLGVGNRFVAEATKPVTGDAAHDVLDHYASELAAVGAEVVTAPQRLVAVFAIMLGLGMRESSGRHCCGPDAPKDRGPAGKPVPTTPENAEAGLFQVSYDSIHRNADRQALVDAYKGRDDLLAVFGEGSHCGKPDNWPAEVGEFAPRDFQWQMKECPLFAALYTAMLLRQERGHWGPINRKKAEARQDAVDLFTRIATIIDAD